MSGRTHVRIRLDDAEFITRIARSSGRTNAEVIHALIEPLRSALDAK